MAKLRFGVRLFHEQRIRDIDFNQQEVNRERNLFKACEIEESET